MKTGLLFGTFNPVHKSHLIVAEYLAQWQNLDEVWLVVTPHNPHKDKAGLLDDTERLHMVELATENIPHFQVSTIEFELPQPNYTVDTLAALQAAHPDRTFFLLMGADNFLSLPRWKDPEGLLHAAQLLVYPRPGAEIPSDHPLLGHARVAIADGPLMERSATAIRAKLGLKGSANDELPRSVAAYIEARQHYRS